MISNGNSFEYTGKHRRTVNQRLNELHRTINRKRPDTELHNTVAPLLRIWQDAERIRVRVPKFLKKPYGTFSRNKCDKS